MSTPIYAARLKAAREATNLSPQEVAAAVGVSPGFYYDLETHGDLTSTVSLARLHKICGIVHVQPRTLFSDSPPRDVVSLTKVFQGIKELCRTEEMTISQFEIDVGWGVQECLDDPDAALDKWNVDCLKDICSKLRIDWLTVLPASI